jgi:CRISPR-associated endonuclease Cas2
MRCIISYDISDDKRRQKVHKMIKKSGGTRLQFSVYLLHIKSAKLNSLLLNIRPYIHTLLSESVYVWSVDNKNMPLHIDDNKLKHYLSDQIEDIFL